VLHDLTLAWPPTACWCWTRAAWWPTARRPTPSCAAALVAVFDNAFSIEACDRAGGTRWVAVPACDRHDPSPHQMERRQATHRLHTAKPRANAAAW
jgi:hypothetical protein